MVLGRPAGTAPLRGLVPGYRLALGSATRSYDPLPAHWGCNFLLLHSRVRLSTFSRSQNCMTFLRECRLTHQAPTHYTETYPGVEATHPSTAPCMWLR